MPQPDLDEELAVETCKGDARIEVGKPIWRLSFPLRLGVAHVSECVNTKTTPASLISLPSPNPLL